MWKSSSYYFCCIGAAISAATFLFAGTFSQGTNTPRIHPPIAPRVQVGAVTGGRNAIPYRYALGAQGNAWGNMYCEGRSGQVPIKRTSIFRVETATHFYDLSKICGMDGDFRWPRTYVGGDNNDYDTWDHWEQLRRGDKVQLILQKTPVRLSLQKCQKLGLISAKDASAAMSIGTFGLGSTKPQSTYNSHCVYKVPIMHVHIKWSTTEVSGVGAHGTDVNVQTWDFRVVGSGPRVVASATPIGADYSASLPPPW